MLESIKKLRECIGEYCYPESCAYKEITYSVQAVEQEIAERYMKLPVDADGVVIRIGDKMIVNGEKKRIIAVGESRFVTTDGEIALAEYHSHATFETVREAINALLRERAAFDFHSGSIEDLVSKYAEILQLRGDAS